MRTLAIIVVVLVVGYFSWRHIAKRRIMMDAQKTQAAINSAVEHIRGLDSVVAGGVSALALVHSLWVNAVAALKAANPEIDTSQLDAAAAESEKARADLAAAIAANTPASDEVHESTDGGTGSAPAASGGTVVDPTTVDTTPVVVQPDPAPEGGAGTGGDAEKPLDQG